MKATEPAQFIIDETFGVPGVGTVVAGEGAGCRVCALRSYSFLVCWEAVLYLILIRTRGSVKMIGEEINMVATPLHILICRCILSFSSIVRDLFQGPYPHLLNSCFDRQNTQS